MRILVSGLSIQKNCVICTTCHSGLFFLLFTAQKSQQQNTSSASQHCLKSFREWDGARNRKMHSYIYIYVLHWLFQYFQHCHVLVWNNWKYDSRSLRDKKFLRVDNIVTIFFIVFFQAQKYHFTCLFTYSYCIALICKSASAPFNNDGILFLFKTTNIV